MVINDRYRHNSHHTSAYDKYNILGTEIGLIIIGADSIHTMNMHMYKMYENMMINMCNKEQQVINFDDNDNNHVFKINNYLHGITI